ncbi:Imidazole glycerol phosphate synthase subunit HisH 1 [Posidoniimonas corsicana]|uniref:Imidazole glycerol phosphate synthase subunit HisH n=1 Tax=Posidoniimonas corsicana TaxID=1938618 RepID=A0A5C5V5B1_9BACT|nr:imidazole glycerol phosphate synthase subunit HisH [Posidoniimonas corsicana]TWT33728.1 Imidazole glycerol phosphate synthase subunit HisH 1 [Posidoniimonas corsicana]
MLAIINYEMGNLRSVQKALEKVGHDAVITDDPAQIAAADKLVLPGVGAYADAIAALRKKRLVEPIQQAIADGRPFLGVCLGMQLLFDVSYEDGEHQGLGVVPGRVVKFDVPRELKVPHMGWNQAAFAKPTRLFSGVQDNAYFYFVHSYYVVPEDEGVVAARCDYGSPFCAAIERDNLFATQFHPEKSQADGLRVLKNFAEL